MSTFLKLAGLLFVALAVFLFLGYSALTSISSLRWINPGRTALMIERGGSVHQSWVPLSRISPNLRRAVVMAEDGNFYNHYGIDYFEMRESIRKNMHKKRFARGFSTITMQLAKNLYLSRNKTIFRKALEILIALKMEQDLSKDRILEIYLNIIEWGPGVYGAEAAAQHYFRKTASALNAEESAFLAAIIPNPIRWGRWPPGPYISRRKGILLARLGMRPRSPKEETRIPELSEEPPEESPEESDDGSKEASDLPVDVE